MRFLRVVVLPFFCFALLLFGCRRDEPAPPWEFEREVIGVVSLSESRSAVLDFHLNAQVWETWLGFAIPCEEGGAASVCSNLELKVYLYEDESDDPFCRFDVGSANLMSCDWFNDHSVVVKNTEPFLFRSPPSSEFRYPSIFYYGRDTYPLSEGVLVPDADYCMEIEPSRREETAVGIEVFLYKRLRAGLVQDESVTGK